MAPHTRSRRLPQTPTKKRKRREADTLDEQRFFDAFEERAGI